MAKVTLIAHTPDPERLIAASAKLCYSPASISDLMDGLDEEKTTSFLNMLSDFGHQSPIEHISFTFGIEEVSRTLLAQITRHRIASFSVQSQRYVKEKQFSFVTPPEIAADEQTSALYQQAMKSAHDSYLQLADILQQKHYRQMVEQGMDEKKAKSAAEKKAISGCAAATAPSGRSATWPPRCWRWSNPSPPPSLPRPGRDAFPAPARRAR